MKKELALYFSWVLACLSVLGSLYFSVIRNLDPCDLCWYQRIALFPLVPILGIAAYRTFFEIIPFVLPQIFLGLLVALYQVGIQEIPNWHPIELCGSGPSCVEKIHIGLGFVTIPMLSAGVFFLMGTLLTYALLQENEPKKLAYVYVK